jgi:ATP adenylyltransferase
LTINLERLLSTNSRSQLEPLTENDFEALWLTVHQLEGLAFHNCGKKSGASQPHKHMQFIPLPIHQSLPDLPFEAAIRDGRKSTKLGEPFSASVATLPFVHWVSMVQEPGSNLQLSGKFLCETYKKLYQLVVDFEARQSATNSADMKKEDIHYNLLMTSRWMMIVPRSNEQHQNIFVNSLGFAGTMFVKSTEDADTLKRVGPFSILRCVGFDPAPAPEL